MAKYLIVGQHSWSERQAEWVKQHDKKNLWNYVSTENDLNFVLNAYDPPDKIFFMHWSNKVPAEIVNTYECICFHPSHLPYGRGGTPVQNLISRGFKETKLTAFRMTNEIDAGPIYLQADLSLEGEAQEIYHRIAKQSTEMMQDIIKYDIKPVPQEGEVVIFKRRTPEQSEIGETETLNELYDHIRMLSAENYPFAFIQYGNYKFEICSPTFLEDKIVGRVWITKLS